MGIIARLAHLVPRPGGRRGLTLRYVRSLRIWFYCVSDFIVFASAPMPARCYGLRTSSGGGAMTSSTTQDANVTDADIDAFQSDGAVCLRQLLRPDQIELLRAGIEANLAQPSPRAKVASGTDDPGRFIEDFCNWQYNEYYRRFIFES